MEFRLLGSVEVVDGDRLLEVVSPQRRHVLAALAVDAGRPVTVETLIDRVWDEAPASARGTLHAHITRIRRLLEQVETPRPEKARLLRRSGGYVLDIDPEQVDLHRFQRMVERGRDASVTDRERAGLLRRALGEWQGEPLSGLPGQWAARTRERWIQQHLEVSVAWSRAEVGIGRAEHVIATLTELAMAHPLAEPLIAALMRALHAAGRQADALHLHDRTRRELAEQLGVDPGPDVQDAHRAVLLGEPAEASDPRRGHDTATRPNDASGIAPAAPPRPVPMQLPADVHAFTGRDAELARLDALFTTTSSTEALAETDAAPRAGDRNGRPAPVVISVVSGTAGVGKTAVTVHWAHRVRARFPDGQLYVDLRGYDPDQPLTAADALTRFLTALGVAGHEIPLDTDDRAARFRTETAGRRMLIVLDNAATVEQVRPLLPGAGTCAVLVTSRDSLAGLVARDGAHRLHLDLLPATDAHTLLHRLIGSRVTAEPDAMATLADRCARLPLALRIAAELAATRPTAALADLVIELACQQQRLDLLDAGGDPRAAMTAVFSWSVRHLPPDAARTFGLLGLHPGPDLDAYAAAALADTGLTRTCQTLDLLTRAHLIHPVHAGRYGMHDLLRAYAAGLATADDATDDPRASLRRLFDYYLATAATAMDHLHPAEALRRPRIPPPATPTPDLTDPDAARIWLDAERPCLTALAAQTATRSLSTHVMRLSPTLFRYLLGGHYTDALAIHGYARDAAQHVGDPAAEAQALLGLGGAYANLGQYELAGQRFQQALTLFRHAGDGTGQARALGSLGAIDERLGHYESAAEHHERALLLFRQAGDRVGEGHVLKNLGDVAERLGRHTSALDYHREALTLSQQVGNRSGEAWAHNEIGILEAWLGRYESAADHQSQALTLFQQLGDRSGEAWALDGLGMVQARLGAPRQAAEHHQQALTLFRATGDQDGEAWALNGLGEAAQAAGLPAGADTHHTAALAIAQDTRNRDQQARAHAGLGRTHQSLGMLSEADSHYSRALTLYTELGMPDAEDIRARRATLSPIKNSGIALTS